MEKQEYDLREYVSTYKDLVHPNVVKIVQQGDKAGLRMAMNQVHYNSLRELIGVSNMKAILGDAKEMSKMKTQGEDKKEGSKVQSYKNVLVKPGVQKGWVEKDKQELGEKALGSLGKDIKITTVFGHNLPEKLNTLAIWRFMRKWGRILDCTIPVRKDKLGKKYDFLKLQTIDEVENFIEGINGKSLTGNIIRAQFAKKQIKKALQMERKKGGMEDAGIKGKEEKQEPPPIKTENKANEEKLSIKLETTESVLTSDVAMSLIVKSWKDCSIVEVLNSIELLGYEGVLVRGLSSRKFLVTFPSLEIFLDLDQDLFGLGFLDCYPASIDDMVLPRKLVLECLGLPITMWKFSNFAKIVEELGDITAISRLLNENLQYQTPKLEIETKEMKSINKKVMIESEGRHFMILLKEVENAEIKESILDELREEEFPVGIEEERDLPGIKENEDQESSEESEESSPINNEKSKQYGPYQVVVDEQGQDGFVQGDVNLGEQVDFGMQGQVGSLHGSANSGEQILGDVRQHDRDNLQIVPVESREEEVVKETPEASISKTSSNLIWSVRRWPHLL
ncbi:hypothetical protein DCAR_0623060 [Daucus carota subsp. sativus]|uniref:Uncharacterized protein n=1 Tax=Daucus carota subsp. sativus TaxID=79200 RepID=A0A161YAY3_DAUCS|nr:hypothetical protein DCAR_0623060 [Daucus carota subsp. sativus]